MCGRFTLTTEDVAVLARAWGAEVDDAVRAAWRPRFNVAPGDAHLVLRAADGGRRLARASFGLAGAGGKLLLNARIETAAGTPSFREAWRLRRGAVPADGFFEWDGPGAARRPTWFHRPDRGPLLLAALWGGSPGGGIGFAILTTEADAIVRPVHDRMPVIVPSGRLDAWLAGAPGALPCPDVPALVATRVSQRVNSVANDDAACLAPAPPDAQRTLL
ncbi:SOS response-associated peptidase [Anaeromyxobacter oryzae]|uniref:Abasic site processing protein n=1 Tax=Anaeromyxobacter oryzae TaxID=2918170 RepID=A0ABM7X369_9BACT|nr:SOS response-associated peptidase [Anaeromyxobacter oryzae]BDG06234.1 DUF159 family protein [Anaeromyxobacter oryzae]